MLYDIAIIGAGVIGSAIARESSKYQLKVALFDKESDVAEGISKANSGVIHAGFYVKSGSLKAKFNILGLEYFPKICYELDVPYKLCKKLVIAKDNEELKYLEKLYEQGLKNGCKGLSIIDEKQIKKLEPYVRGKYALFSEKTSIVPPYEFVIALAENAYANGVDIYLNSKVTNIEKSNDIFNLIINNEKVFNAKIIVNAAGMFSDEIYSMLTNHSYKIYSCRAEYFLLDTEASKYINIAIYPVPPDDGAGLGVHLTKTINGNILIGPSVEYLEDKEDVRNTKNIMEYLKKEAYQLLPELKEIPFIKSFSGIRPKLFKPESGKDFEDFIIKESDKVKGLINLIGIESPGLTAAPAIAKYVLEELVGKNLILKVKKDFIPNRIGIMRTKFLSSNELKKLYKKDKNYGEVICRCEQVTKAEILQAINNPLGVKTLNGIKKRASCMMGRCQGGYCIPKISDILVKETNLEAEKIFKNNKKSNIFLGYEN